MVETARSGLRAFVKDIYGLAGNGVNGDAKNIFSVIYPKILFFKGVRSSIDSSDVTETPGDPPTPARRLSNGSPLDNEYGAYSLIACISNEIACHCTQKLY